MTYRVGTKGQVVIDKQIRDALGVEGGYLASQRLVGDHVEIRFYPPEHERSLRGVLAGKVKHKVRPERWTEAREEAWKTAAEVKEAQERDG